MLVARSFENTGFARDIARFDSDLSARYREVHNKRNGNICRYFLTRDVLFIADARAELVVATSNNVAEGKETRCPAETARRGANLSPSLQRIYIPARDDFYANEATASSSSSSSSSFSSSGNRRLYYSEMVLASYHCEKTAWFA